ncbi:hypothetical protein JCM3263A_15030 [Thermobifida fusca]
MPTAAQCRRAALPPLSVLPRRQETVGIRAGRPASGCGVPFFAHMRAHNSLIGPVCGTRATGGAGGGGTRALLLPTLDLALPYRLSLPAADWCARGTAPWRVTADTVLSCRFRPEASSEQRILG